MRTRRTDPLACDVTQEGSIVKTKGRSGRKTISKADAEDATLPFQAAATGGVKQQKTRRVEKGKKADAQVNQDIFAANSEGRKTRKTEADGELEEQAKGSVASPKQIHAKATPPKRQKATEEAVPEQRSAADDHQAPLEQALEQVSEPAAVKKGGDMSYDDDAPEEVGGALCMYMMRMICSAQSMT